MEVGGLKQEDIMAPLSLLSLRLLVPPVRLMSAALWRTVQQQDVMQYGMIADFVSLVTEAVPEHFSTTHAVELVLGLRAKLILELCCSDEAVDTNLIQPHLNNIKLVFSLLKQVNSTEQEESAECFVEMVQALIKDPEQREHFFRYSFPEEFGPSFDSALQTLMWDFLSRLEHFLPVPDLFQTVSWLKYESSALQDCRESISNPGSLRSLLHHPWCLRQLDTCAFPSLTSHHILTALSGRKKRSAHINSGLHPPVSIPICVLDGTDLETVVVTSDCTGMEMYEKQTREDYSNNSDTSLPATDCKLNHLQANRNTVESELIEKHTDTDKYFRLSYHEHHTLEHHTHDKVVGEEQIEHNNNSVSPSLESTLTVPVSIPAAGLPFSIGTRRSARKPNKTWKLKLINLQKQKRKYSRKKQAGTLHTPVKNLEMVLEKAGERVMPDNGDDDDELVSSGPVKSGNTALSQIFSCPYCRFTHNQERYVKSHMKKVHYVSSTTKKEPHVCQVCGKSYRYSCMLRAHQRSHTGEQPFHCSVNHCGRRFSYIQALRRHLLVHSIKKTPQPPRDKSLSVAELKKGKFQKGESWMYTCLYCSKSFSSLSARREHHKMHPEDELKRCIDCGKQLSCQAALIRHKQRHFSERPHKCLLCGSSFACPTSFKRHMLIHRPEKPHRCSCGKGFTYKGALLSHQQIHTSERRYRCSCCNRCFLYPGQLRKHERTHSDEKPYLCPHCGKSFKRQRILHAHVAGHTDDKIFKCSLCNKTFAYKASLTRHELTHTGERPFLCSDCGKTFFSFGELLKHQRYHTGIKPFQCSHCDKSFTQSCYLQLHTRYHTGVRPYTCPQCSKSFFTSCRLKRHMQIHTDEKPFECTECGKRFRQAYVLKVHSRIHLEKEMKV